MDDLDLLKKDWKKQEKDLPHFSHEKIYKMLWKRSSSIVKWIFIISICEIVFWTVLNIFMADEAYWERIEKIHLTEFTIVANIINYLITIYFIYRFYRNYKKINTTDSASLLMKNILATRKTVKYYIGYILISSALLTLVYIYFMVFNHKQTMNPEDASKYVFDFIDWLKFGAIVLLGLAAFLGVLWLFYRLLYGILLKRLNKNYKELKKLEM